MKKPKGTKPSAKRTTKRKASGNKPAPRPQKYKAEKEWIGDDAAGAGKRMKGLYINAPTPPPGAGVAPPAQAAHGECHLSSPEISQMADASHASNDALMDMARDAVEHMGQSYREAKTKLEKDALERDMKILLGHVKHELGQMGHKSPGLCYMMLRKDAIERIEILKERGIKATDNRFRLSAVDDLAFVLYATLDAMAVLAVEHKDIQAVRYLAWLSEPGKHHHRSRPPFTETAKRDPLRARKGASRGRLSINGYQNKDFMPSESNLGISDCSGLPACSPA